MDVVKAGFYPNINLTAFAGLTSLGFGHWINASSRDYGVGPAISLPIFDAGRLRAQLSSKDAEYDMAVESYNQALIAAVHDVADQLSSIYALSQLQNQHAELQRNAVAVFELAQRREQAGLISRIAVLNAQSAVLAQAADEVNLKTRSIELAINLARALGGGFQAGATVSQPHS